MPVPERWKTGRRAELVRKPAAPRQLLSYWSGYPYGSTQSNSRLFPWFFSIMRSRLIRPLLVFEFLIVIEVWLTFWSQVGGQYHLDLMFWPWKFGLTIAAAWLITAITAELFRGSPEKPNSLSRMAIVYAALLFAVMVTAGVVTYYYH